MGPETYAAAAAARILAAASEPMGSKIAASMKTKWADLRVRYTKTFEAQLTSALRRSAYIKTVTSKDRAIKLEDIYVNLFLSGPEGNRLIEDDIDPFKNAGCRTIIRATGGAGKTILMKHFLNNAVKGDTGKIPIFLELRTIEFASKLNLESIISQELLYEGVDEAEHLLISGLKEGIFVVFLDGFDEVKPGQVQESFKCIERFSRRYPNVSIICSTRPYTGLENLAEFDVYSILPLTKAQALEVVTKTPFDQSAKDKFLIRLDQDLYEKHRSMMSIPILIGMMLLTFRTYADIPDRMTVFYSQAFDTLYSIHDSENKDLFKRKHECGLSPDIFKKILQAFSYLSLSAYDIEFTKDQLWSYLEKSIKLTQVDIRVDDFIKDVVQNVCILQPDGIKFVFVHRSFQEYFAASFISQYSGDRAFEVFDALLRRSSSDVGVMARELDPSKFSRVWLYPKLKILSDICDEYKSISTAEMLSRYMPMIFHDPKEDVVALNIPEGQLYAVASPLNGVSGERISAIEILNKIRFEEVIGDGVDRKVHIYGARRTKVKDIIKIDSRELDDETLSRMCVKEVFEEFFDAVDREIESVEAEVSFQDDLDSTFLLLE